MPTQPLLPTLAKTPAALPALDLGLIEQKQRPLLSAIYNAVNTLIGIVRDRLSLGGGAHGERVGHLDAQWLEVEFLVDAPTPIPHGLGRVPIGWLVVSYSSPGFIFNAANNSWTDELLWLHAEVGGNARIMVF